MAREVTLAEYHGHEKLPYSERLSISTLAGLFRNRTNSYKHLFFLALISRIEEQAEELRLDPWIPLTALGSDMLAIAWYPHVFFKLSFGVQDKVATALHDKPVPDSIMKRARTNIRHELRVHFDATDAAAPLLRYVPQRLIRPFFADDLRGIPDQRVDAEIMRLAANEWSSRLPLYQFAGHGNAIILQPEWLGYLIDNLSILKEWALWEWLQYMQSCNPTAPNLAAKLLPPCGRKPLTNQRKFWNTAIKYWPKQSGLFCPYSGRPLQDSHYDLDHFLPWSFVAHDRLWNLIPADTAMNADKSDRLPDQRYVDTLATTHALALRSLFTAVEQQELPEARWRSVGEEYVVDLHLHGLEDLLRADRVREAYDAEVRPLLALAQAHGFQAGWVAHVA